MDRKKITANTCRFKRGIVFTLFLFLFFYSCRYDKVNPVPKSSCDSLSSTFSHGANPIIATKCATSGCHSNGFTMGDFTTYAGVMVRVNDSTFSQRVFDMHIMPPSSAPQLTSDEYQKLKCWVNAGAPNN